MCDGPHQKKEPVCESAVRTTLAVFPPSPSDSFTAFCRVQALTKVIDFVSSMTCGGRRVAVCCNKSRE